MTVAYGVTDSGFIRKPADIIQTEIQNKLLRLRGKKLNLDPRSVNGQYIGISVGSYNDIWQLLELMAAAQRPASATGQGLTDLAAITGTIRKAATPTKVVCIAVGVSSTVIPLGSIVTNLSALVQFTTDAGVTLAPAPAWLASHAYPLDTVVTNSGHIYVAITAGTSGTSGPTTTPAYPTTIIDGTVIWAYIGDGDSIATLNGTCTVTGAIFASAFSASRIGTPISGWNAVANPNDATLGNDIESDENLRIRRVVELHSLSTGPLEAILAALVNTKDVIATTVFENTDNITNSDGVPAHSIEAVVEGGADADIRQTLFLNTPSGIQTYGLVSGSVTDSRGRVKTIKFTRPTELDIYLNIVLYADVKKLPSDAIAIATQRVITYGEQYLTMGYDVEPFAIGASIAFDSLGNRMPGLLRVSMKADIIPVTFFTPENVPISVGPRQFAKLDSTRLAMEIVNKIP